MKAEEMVRHVEDLTHESYEMETWLRWFNEALQDLAPVIKLETYEEFAVNGTSAGLPGDICDVRVVKLNNDKYNRIGIGEKPEENDRVYWIWDGSIYFPESKSGTVKLWYFRYPETYGLGSDRPDIQASYIDAVILYAAAKSKAPDRWLQDKGDLYQDYIIRKGQIEEERNKQLKRPRFAHSGRWT
jgi:hypothetical protein